MKMFKGLKKEMFKVVYIDDTEYTVYVNKIGLNNLIISCDMIGAEIKSVERI